MTKATALLPLDKQSPTSKVDWGRVLDLGDVRDSIIARRYKVSQTAVLLARRRRNIPPFKTNSRYNIDWDSIPLGQYVDEHIADMLGCSKILVWKERTHRKIPPYGMNYRTLENEGAYYGEAIIDMWLHNNKIPHKFQKQIGPYRVDWLLNNSVILEFLGMWDHQIHGELYQSNFYTKRSYLLNQGFTVREIYRSAIKSFKATVDLRALLTLGTFMCHGCGRKDVKHQAHSLCTACYTRIRKGKKLGPITHRLRKEDVFTCADCGSDNRWKRVKDRCRLCYNKAWKLGIT
jgi:hypothetical protein